VASALAGMIAAVPMAWVMRGLNRVLPVRKTSWLTRLFSLPPKQVTKRISRRAGVPWVTKPGRRWDSATWLAHLGYGAAAASLYPVVTRPLPVPNIVRGMLFAIAVWAGSYLGWLPATNIMKPATRESARRNIVMIVSHLVWGALIGLLATNFSRRMSGPDGIHHNE